MVHVQLRARAMEHCPIQGAKLAPVEVRPWAEEGYGV